MSDVEKIGSAGIPLNIVDANGRKIMGDAYDNTAVYVVGDYCISGDHAYKCITKIETPEDFNTNHWQQVTIEEILKEHDVSIESVNASLPHFQQVQFGIGTQYNIPADTSQEILDHYDITTSTAIDTVFTNKTLAQLFGGHIILGIVPLWINGGAMIHNSILWTDAKSISVTARNVSSSSISVNSVRLLVIYN